MKVSSLIVSLSLLISTTVFAGYPLRPLIYGSVAQVENFQSPNGKIGAPGGKATGVLIHPSGLLLTNIHVVVACMDALGEKDPWRPSLAVVGKLCPPDTIKVSFPMAPGKPSVQGARIVAVGQPPTASPDALSEDWVLLSLNRAALRSVPVVHLSRREVTPAEPIRIAGFPAIPVGRLVSVSSKMFETIGRVESSQEAETIWKQVYASLPLTPDQFSQLFAYVSQSMFDNRAVFFHNALIFQGYSGGPMFDAAGDVVGLAFGNASVWNFEYGEYPSQTLGLDPSRPDKLANRLSTGIRMSSICREIPVCW